MTQMYDEVQPVIGALASLVALGISLEDARVLAAAGHIRRLTTREMFQAITELASGIDCLVYTGTFAEYIAEMAEGCRSNDPDALFDLEVEGLIPVPPLPE